MSAQSSTDADIATHLLAQGMQVGAATLTVELTRSLIQPAFFTGFDIYPDKYPLVFVNAVFARWTLDFAARTAGYVLYIGGEPLASKTPLAADFGRVSRMEVEDVGEMPLTVVVRNHGNDYSPVYDDFDLVRADGDWECSLYAVRAGEHFIRFTSYREPPRPPRRHTFCRIEREAAERLQKISLTEYDREVGNLFYEAKRSAAHEPFPRAV